MSYGYKPSKSAAREFAAKMKEIDDFCIKHGIQQSSSSDSYYFTLNECRYRVSNHTIDASNRKAFNEFGEQVREIYHESADDDLICITASKTRIIEIYTDLVNGYKLDRRGRRIL